ncbi:hypothetical protein Dimus_000380 [Dionaea muscipula]
MKESQRLVLRNSICSLIKELKNLRELKQIHAQLIKSPHLPETERYFLTTRLLLFCAFSESGSLRYAGIVFHTIRNPNLFAYNVMIRAYSCSSDYGQGSKSSSPALILYKKLLFDGIRPDALTFPFAIKECTRRVNGYTGRALYAHVVEFGFHEDVYIQNCVIRFCSECGFLGDAWKLFDEMSRKDTVSWNSMIVGCLRNGDLDCALDLFRRMDGSGSGSGRDIYSWNSMITGFVRAGRATEALDFFREMLLVLSDNENGGVRPDKVTVASVLSACASVGAIDYGNWVHCYLKRRGLEFDMVLRTALVDMYGKCGDVERALEIFNQMLNKDVFAWTAMISVFAIHGCAKEAFNLFRQMEQEQGVKPNHVTFVGLLSACAHSGLVEEGRRCFHMMRRVYLIEPRVYHYACMVSIFSRAALFDEAQLLIRNMPMEPDAFVWGALLGGCQFHGNADLGEKVAARLIDLDPLNHAFYMNLCDLYGKEGRLHDMKRVRNFMQDNRIQKDIPGCSMIQVDGIIHEFSVSVRGSIEVAKEEEIVWVLELLAYDMNMDWQLHAMT